MALFSLQICASTYIVSDEIILLVCLTYSYSEQWHGDCSSRSTIKVNSLCNAGCSPANIHSNETIMSGSRREN